MKKLLNPEDARWESRRGAAATVQIRKSYSRYVHGEAVIETVYRLPGGGEDRDPPSRIFLGGHRSAVITQLWDKLFDAVLVAREYAVDSVIIDFKGDTFAVWGQDFLITLFIVAHELDVLVSGVFLSNLLVKPRNLSDDLDTILFRNE